jgi:hypothetical protein
MDTDYLFCIFKLIIKKAKTCNTGILTKTGLDILLAVVCRRAHVLFTLFVFVCVVHSGFLVGGWGVRLVSLILPISLDCSLLSLSLRYSLMCI